MNKPDVSDLFGDEDIGIDMPTIQPTRDISSLKRVILILLIPVFLIASLVLFVFLSVIFTILGTAVLFIFVLLAVLAIGILGTIGGPTMAVWGFWEHLYKKQYRWIL